MKKRLSALIFAAILLTGCADTQPTSGQQTSATCDTSAATDSTTSAPVLQSTTASTDSNPTVTDDTVKWVGGTELFRQTAWELGNNVDGYFSKNNPIINIENNVITTAPPEYKVFNSFGVMSKGLSDDFKNLYESDFSKISYHTNKKMYNAENFGSYTVQYNVEPVRSDYVKLNDYTVTLKSAKIYRRNAFIRKTKNDDYEFIIDPRYMYDIPLITDDYSYMKFDVNGTEMYGDTLAVHGCKLNVIGDAFDSYGLEADGDYVYASVTFKDMDIVFNSESGYSNAADVIKIEVLTEDTDSVINGNYYGSDEIQPLETTISKLIDEFYKSKSRSSLIDLDFDGTPELIHSYFHPYADMGEYMINDIYMIDDSAAKLVDTIRFDFLYEAEYNGKHGWIVPYQEVVYSEEGYVDHYSEIGAMFFALENGELYKYKFGYYHLEPEDQFILNGESVAVTDTEPITIEFNGTEIIQCICNGYVGNYVYGAFNNALQAEYEPYLVNDTYTLYYGDHNYSYGSESSYALKSQIIADLVRLYNEPMELQYRDEAAQYFEGGKAKPVIYLYPEEATDVTVKVDFPYGGEFSCTYPDYRDGWSVTAMPDGTLFDADGNEYYCLYWEGEGGPSYDMKEGFCVKGGDTAEFLREKLLYMGLSAREVNEFIIYWLPLMEDNPYNVISFHAEAYDETAPLTVSPAPDSVIRVFMTWYASDEYLGITEQELPVFERNGFTVVEWGGSQYGK